MIHVAKSIGHRLYRFPEENDSRGVKMKRIIQNEKDNTYEDN